eukprot:512286_1
MSSIECSDDKDCLSTWIQNKLFLSQIDNSKINELQNHIISNVFGDFNGLLSSLLKYYDDRCMTHLQQLKLNNILSKVDPTSINTTVKNNKSLTILPDDCIINIMGFMDYKSKVILQYCCRTLSIIARKPLGPNNNTKYLMSIGSYKHTIASLILSNNFNDNITAVEMINQYVPDWWVSSQILKVNTYLGSNPIGRKIFSCHTNVASRLATILNNNISNKICQECVLILMYDEMFIYEILPSISYMLHSETTGENKDHILQFLCNSNFNHHGRLDDEVFVFNMIQKKNYSVLLQPILQLDFQDVNSYCGNILRKIASIGCGEQLLSNPLLVKALNEKIKHEKIESFLKLQTWSKVDQKWYNDSMIVSVNNGKWVKIHYDGRSDNDDEWHNLHNYQHCSEIKFNENSYEYLQTIRYIFIRLNVNQRIRIIKKGYFKNLDVYCRTFIMGTLDFSFIEMFENYAKRWKIINKYMSVLVNRNIIEIFDQWIHDNEYDFTAIINDINQYENTQSVILSSMKKILSWNKARCDSFFCILKLILIVEVFDFDDEYIQKCMIDMIRKYYNNNISIFPSIPSTNYFRNYFRIVNKFTKDDSRYESWMHVDDSEEQNEWLMEYDFISMKKVRYKKYSDEMYRCKKKKKKTSID